MRTFNFRVGDLSSRWIAEPWRVYGDRLTAPVTCSPGALQLYASRK